jgi:serine protease AprX
MNTKFFFLALASIVCSNSVFAQSKINAALLAELKTKPRVSCLVVMREQADVSGANALATKTEKAWHVYNVLTQTADRTQTALKTVLLRQNVAFQSFWAVNALHITAADLALLTQIAQSSEVESIQADAEMTYHQPTKDVANEPMENRIVVVPVTWGITQIKADQAWALGYTGTNVVVGGEDTGYKWDIATIKNKYRGWDGTTANHNYNWHDAIHVRDTNYTTENPFGYDSQVPVDDNSHGTHTMGTMVGDVDDMGTKIGVAPSARWVGCRNMERGWGKPSTYIECMEWFMAPTNLQNTAPNPALAPHVINNSWGCPPSEGCNASNFGVMNTVILNLKASGVFVTVSAGNSGSSCSSVKDPAAIFEPSFSVGASNDMDGIAGFSSRGPVTADGSNRRKPNVAAPGVNVRSCTPDGSFQNWNGTSMAGPHVAGAVALIISARPALAGHVDMLENILEQTAEHLLTTEACGGDSPTATPNNTFGFGRIDVLRAIQSALTVVISTENNTQNTAFANIIPNPAHDAATLQLKGFSGNTSLQIFNTTGQIVHQTDFLSHNDILNKTIDVSAFANGVYFYTIYNGVQKISGKMVVAR